MLDTLLEVQASDTAADQLRHRRATLPERAALAAVEARAAEVRAQLDDVSTRRAEVLGRQAKLEEAVAAASRRVKDIETRLYGGMVSATKDIMAMTAEVESLRARNSTLEDEVLATMEEDEPLAAELERLQEELAALGAEAERAGTALAEAETAVDAELAGLAEVRAGQAGSVPDDLLATYERLRARLGGEGAARLSGRSCTGCHLTLPAQELDRIKHLPPDAVVLCDQCGRILVRSSS
ncbi:MAG TPA: C4-type zinc ribbon domain-containing protein [Acidimicrobiales bacterium]|nr:C4-type zinc ribbon domain-containing protein [Acidimicrobiales bacterium]